MDVGSLTGNSDIIFDLDGDNPDRDVQGVPWDSEKIHILGYDQDFLDKNKHLSIPGVQAVGMPLSDYDLEYLGEGLKYNTVLTELAFCALEDCDEECGECYKCNWIEMLSKGLAKNKSIKILCLSEIHIYRDDLEDILEALKENRTLEVLRFGCIMTSEVYQTLTNFMIHNTSLKGIDLQGVDIMDMNVDDRGEMILNILRCNTTLEFINIAYINMSDEMTLELFQLIKTHLSLLRVILSRNSWSEVVDKLEEILAEGGFHSAWLFNPEQLSCSWGNCVYERDPVILSKCANKW